VYGRFLGFPPEAEIIVLGRREWNKRMQRDDAAFYLCGFFRILLSSSWTDRKRERDKTKERNSVLFYMRHGQWLPFYRSRPRNSASSV
jgi:hypothetical protein